ncbi:MAG: hypothetical protein QOD97_362, partial [Mycobacterium sp.]|nr:hypothetical protein [Mycobacterium sp.]
MGTSGGSDAARGSSDLSGTAAGEAPALEFVQPAPDPMRFTNGKGVFEALL